MELKYETRDGKGNDIVKMVKIKEFQSKTLNLSARFAKKNRLRVLKLKERFHQNLRILSL